MALKTASEIQEATASAKTASASVVSALLSIDIARDRSGLWPTSPHCWFSRAFVSSKVQLIQPSPQAVNLASAKLAASAVQRFACLANLSVLSAAVGLGRSVGRGRVGEVRVFPVVGEELFEFRGRRLADVGQDAGQVALRVDRVAFGAGDQ